MSGSLPHSGLAELRHAVKILAACALAYSITWSFHLPEGYWCLITVIIVTHPDLQGNRLKPPLLPTVGETCAVRRPGRILTPRKKARTSRPRSKSSKRFARNLHSAPWPSTPPCFLGAENLADVPPPRSPRHKTKTSQFKRLSCPDLPGTVTTSRDRLVGSLIGAAVGAIAAHLRGKPTLQLYAVELVPLAMLIAVWPSLRLSCITLTIVLLPSAEGTDFFRPMYCVLGTLLGTAVATLVAFPALLRRGQSAPTG